MARIKQLFEEKNIRRLFEFNLLVKGLFAFFEIVGGITPYFISPQFILRTVQSITQNELSEDPRDFISSHLLHWAENFSVSTQHFTAFYLLSHGVIKLWLIWGLYRDKLWYYPVSIAVF